MASLAMFFAKAVCMCLCVCVYVSTGTIADCALGSVICQEQEEYATNMLQTGLSHKVSVDKKGASNYAGHDTKADGKTKDANLRQSDWSAFDACKKAVAQLQDDFAFQAAVQNDSLLISVDCWNRAAQKTACYRAVDSRCEQADATWLLVRDPRYKPSSSEEILFESIKTRSPICVTILDLPQPPEGRRFWEMKVVAIRDYLLDHPHLEFMISTDSFDVWLNHMTHEGLMSSFRRITAGRAPVLFATEQPCFRGHLCSSIEAWNWTKKFREEYHRTDVKFFLNSQYMGERRAVLNFLDYAFGAEPGRRGFPAEVHNDDQEMLWKAMFERPDLATMDWDEIIFASMLRGMRPDNSSRRMCYFGGQLGTSCSVSADWGDCQLSSDGVVTVYEEQVGGRRITPMIFHFNGPAKYAINNTKHCSRAFQRHQH